MAELPMLIKFRLLADMLDENEFDTFLSEIAGVLGRDKIMKMLFNQFKGCSVHKLLDQITLDSAIKVIEEIIKNRKMQPTNDSSPVTIDSLPSALIGKIASFCYEKYHILLSRCNRAIYIGTNTPNTLQRLDLPRSITAARYSMIDTTKYSQIRKLDFELHLFKHFAFPSDRKVFPQLTHLTIDNEALRSWIEDLDLVIDCTAIQFMRVTQLRLNFFFSFDVVDEELDYGDDLPKKKFLELLSRFPKLKYLKLEEVAIEGEFNMNDDQWWGEFLPDLQALHEHAVGSPDCINSIIRSRANQLKMLMLHGFQNAYDFPVDLCFGSLEELHCDSHLNDNVMEILRGINDTRYTVRLRWMRGHTKTNKE